MDSKGFAVLFLALSAGCHPAANESRPCDDGAKEDADDRRCEDRGGQCQTADLPCSEGTEFGGYAGCELGDVCCLPEAPDGGAAHSGDVVCGPALCDSAVEICLGCSHEDGNRDVHCVSRDPGEDQDFVRESIRLGDLHGCSLVGSVYLECDGSEDCGEGQECVFSNGEAGWAYCVNAGQYARGVACVDASSCSDEAPACGVFDPRGYFAPYADLLGWSPQACQDE